METRAGYLIVGTFVLLSFLGILGFFLWLAKSDLEPSGNLYSIYFKGSVTGLTLGGSVNYLGVPVGTVKKIELDSENPELVHLVIGIKKSVPVKEDAYASLELQGLTGYKNVQIFGGSKDSPPLQAKPGQTYPVIPSRYSGVEEIMTTLPRMINKFTNLVDRFNETFNEQNRERFSDILKNTETLSKQLAETSAPLKDLVTNANTAIKTFDHEIKTFSGVSQGTFTEFKSIAQDINALLKDNKGAIDSLIQGGSYDLLHALKETRELLTSATRFFDHLDKNPRSFLFKPQRKGVYLGE